MDDHWAAWVLIAFLLWLGLYLFCHWLKPNHNWEWHCRCITLLHAVTVTLLSAWAAIVQGPWPFTDPGGPNTPLQYGICVLTLGYFIFDLLWCLYFNTEGPIMLFHHVLSIFGNSLVLARGTNGCEMMAALFGTEITNPLLQCRWFLRQSPRYKGSRLAVGIDFAFLAVFTLMRICIGSVLLYYYISHPRPDWLARSGAVAIYAVGWIFWMSILKYFCTKYVRGMRFKSTSNQNSNCNGVYDESLSEPSKISLSKRNGFHQNSLGSERFQDSVKDAHVFDHHRDDIARFRTEAKVVDSKIT